MAKIRVFIVEDSNFFIKRLHSIISGASDIEIVGVAENGALAIAELKKIQVDVVTMDVTMPELDGINAVKQIMLENPTPILMLSSQTTVGADDTFDALSHGAVDFLSKDVNHFTEVEVLNKIRAVALSQPKTVNRAKKVNNKILKYAKKNFELVLIGTSTGGPVVIENILTAIKVERVPIVILMHLPKGFAEHYSNRISKLINKKVYVLENEEHLLPGNIYLAPGETEITFTENMHVSVKPGDSHTLYQPNIDIAFKSAAEAYKDNLLVIILSGMGSDGAKGATFVKQNGGEIWAQEESSCVARGMPSSIIKNNLQNYILNPTEISQRLNLLFS